ITLYLATALVAILPLTLVDLLLSLRFNFPDLLGGVAALSYGRLRPLHALGWLLGVYTTAAFGLIHYLVPKLCGTRLAGAGRLGFLTYGLWLLGLGLGAAGVLAGYNQGLELAELPWFANIPLVAAFWLLTLQVMLTLFHRREPRLYVSLWYLAAALVWVDLDYPLGNFVLPWALAGVNSAAAHSLYMHYLYGLWINPVGLALAYFLLPLSVRNPLYSHKLALIGFWSMAFFFPFVGTQHYLYSPIANWVQVISTVAGMMLIIPVLTVLQNFYGTMSGQWRMLQDSNTAKFLCLGVVFYLVGSLQGATGGLLELQKWTHFTTYAAAHAHMTVAGAFILWMVAGYYYVWPRLAGAYLYSRALADWHFWLTVAGLSCLVIVESAAGLVQGSLWRYDVDFLYSLDAMRTFWWLRTLCGLPVLAGMWLFVYNLGRTWYAQRLDEAGGQP
ncbi:MAG: cbb3-type cytochrome c oxidase subunit I, partial [Nevskia sp.]|nr:cbb3-type cytochrome c oxidase subunit I [Nevskia sp.]